MEKDDLVSFLNVMTKSYGIFKKDKYPLAGRTEIVIKNFSLTGMVVFKNYFRGGFLSLINRRTYFRFRKEMRPVTEFFLLEKMRDLGLPVPEPVAAYYRGRYIYQGGIVTKYIKSSYTLAEYSIKFPEKAEKIFKGQFLSVYEKLLQNKIYHVDLHPGNVLVGEGEKIFVIDFDKAFISEELPFYLNEKYVKRWNRSILKHNLPDFLIMSN